MKEYTHKQLYVIAQYALAHDLVDVDDVFRQTERVSFIRDAEQRPDLAKLFDWVCAEFGVTPLEAVRTYGTREPFLTVRRVYTFLARRSGGYSYRKISAGMGTYSPKTSNLIRFYNYTMKSIQHQYVRYDKKLHSDILYMSFKYEKEKHKLI